MTEDDALAWLHSTFNISRETETKLAEFAARLVEANSTQNLISTSSESEIYARHIVDSAQLIPLAEQSATWVDLGSGAGFPGLVVAIITGMPVTLVESRRLRSDWLLSVSEKLALDNVTVAPVRVELLRNQAFDLITARAFKPLDELFVTARHLSHADTMWILPKGRTARQDLASAQATWHGKFAMIDSVTQPGSAIITARHLRRRAT